MKSAPEIVVQMIHIQGGLKGKIQEFYEPLITIGRLPTSTLTFPPDEPGVSREHAKIQREGNQFRLVAVHDKYGTFVNGKQVREAVLRAGDVIEFGSGGPKVSFSTEMVESVAEPAQVFSARPESIAGPALRQSISPEAVQPPSPPRIQPSVQQPQWSSPQLQREAPWGRASQDGDGRAAHQEYEKVDLPTGKTTAPLIIQYGPTIRSYRELPVVIGTHVRCDFVLQHLGILDQHVQILFNHGSYFVNDLTGRHMVNVNGRPVHTAMKLNPFDEITCGPQGPVFRFLGEGRLAEVEQPPLEEPAPKAAQEATPNPDPDLPKAPFSGLLSRFVKGIK